MINFPNKIDIQKLINNSDYKLDELLDRFRGQKLSSNSYNIDGLITDKISITKNDSVVMSFNYSDNKWICTESTGEFYSDTILEFIVTLFNFIDSLTATEKILLCDKAVGVMFRIKKLKNRLKNFTK